MTKHEKAGWLIVALMWLIALASCSSPTAPSDDPVLQAKVLDQPGRGGGGGGLLQPEFEKACPPGAQVQSQRCRDLALKLAAQVPIGIGACLATGWLGCFGAGSAWLWQYRDYQRTPDWPEAECPDCWPGSREPLQ